MGPISGASASEPVLSAQEEAERAALRAAMLTSTTFPLHSATAHSLSTLGLPLADTFSTGVATLALAGKLVPSVCSGGDAAFATTALSRAAAVPCLPPPVALAMEWLSAFGMGVGGGALAAAPIAAHAAGATPGMTFVERLKAAKAFVETPLGLCINRVRVATAPVNLAAVAREATDDLGCAADASPRPVDVVMGLLYVRASVASALAACVRG